MEDPASGTVRLVEVMRLCIYPGLTYDQPSATSGLTVRSHIERVEERTRDRESPSYAKLAIESER